MQVTIQGKKTIKELIDEFNGIFPHLKLEFFKHQHDDHEGSPKKDLYKHNLTLGEIRTKEFDGTFTFNKKMVICEFEDTMRDKYGLNIQIFRRSGNLWLETTTSDDWTFEKAEQIGQEMDHLR